MSPRQADPASPILSYASPDQNRLFSPLLLWILWGILMLTAAWRCYLAVSIDLQSDIAGTFGPAVVHWRRLDEFLPWLTIAIFILAKQTSAKTLGQVRLGKILSVLLAIGTLLTAAGIGMDEADSAPAISAAATRIALLLLLLLALILAISDVRAVFRAMSRASSRGLTIIDLWRFAAAQLLLLMAAALAGISLATTREKWLADENIRNLFFFLPALTMPGVLAYAGISLWNDLLIAARWQPPVPRVRAWLLALGLVSVGPLLFLAGLLPRLQAWWLTLPGTAFLLAGVALYLVGFPVSAWKGMGGKAHLAAWFCFAVAILAATLDLVRAVQQDHMSVFYRGAWRYLWVSVITFWLLSMGINALRLLISETKAARWGTALLVLLSIGTLATTGNLLVASAQTGEGQLSAIKWLIAGSGIILAATLLAGTGLFSARRRY